MPKIPFLQFFIFFVVALTSPPSFAAPDSAPALPWDASSQGAYITALSGDRKGSIWAVTESEGVWRYDPLMRRWIQFTQANTSGGLGDDDIYSITCDRLGRVWCGTGRDGVSVFNGKIWRNYNSIAGPLGCHVTALATSPITGDVWGCTENGVFDYELSAKAWHYVTTADGLPANQTDCICFDKTGTVYVGTLCDGIAIASPKDDYHAWRVVKGPGFIPNMPGGDGLPSSQINCLLSTQDGTVYAGTTMGLARSSDGGHHWRFLRGSDWKDKLAGLYAPLTPEDYDTGVHLLTEDYVTSLTEDRAGQLYVGHRQKGLQVYDEATASDVTPPGAYGGYIDALLATSAGNLLIGTYGDGLAQTNWAAPHTAAVLAINSVTSPLPVPAVAPTPTQLTAMLHDVRYSQTMPQVGKAVFVGEDWQTQGCWVGHYGRQYALLCAADAPMDHNVISDPNYAVQIGMGPHHSPGDSIRRWVTWAQTDNVKALYDPIPGFHRQSEADDHGESMVGPNDSFAYAGPDVWATISVPDGLHQVSIYDFNKDGGPGGGGDNRFRDYSVDVLSYQADADAVQKETPLAHARIRNFWGGVYENFLVDGPARYVVRIAKNNSLNTILAGVFIDRVNAPSPHHDCNAWMGGVRYAPPDPDAPALPDPHLLDKLLASRSGTSAPIDPPTPLSLKTLTAARILWKATCLTKSNSGDFTMQSRYAIEAYRAAVQAGAPDDLQSRWRWALHIWSSADHLQFDAAMQKAHASLLALNPDMLNHSY